MTTLNCSHLNVTVQQRRRAYQSPAASHGRTSSTVYAITFAIALLTFACPCAFSQDATSSHDCISIERRLPPKGLAPPEAQVAKWMRRLKMYQTQTSELPRDLQPDIEVLLKACQFAIRFEEFYKKNDVNKVDRLLDLAQTRLSKAKQSRMYPWKRREGLQVRGYRSRVDGSVQPYGLVFPEGGLKTRTNESVPLYVWLHGRGDKNTDLHFICDRLDKVGQIRPAGAIVMHPFGRQCVGYKSAGETDVLEAIEQVCRDYPIDRKRIVLMGFSMGGAGVWHLAARYSELFIAASPGAGFAETARYQRLKPEDYPPAYEQTLWKYYDVPGYVRNLFNLPVIAYSGENDKQIQAARVMEESFRGEGRTLTQLIGPGMGHKYHPDTIQEILKRLAKRVEQGRGQVEGFSLQSPHPRYARRGWLLVDGMQSQWEDTRVDATRSKSDGSTSTALWDLDTQNVSRLIINNKATDAPRDRIRIDGQTLPLDSTSPSRFSRLSDGQWERRSTFPIIRKRPKMSGPIYDAFVDPFLVVLPIGQSKNAAVDAWVHCEVDYWRTRWQTLMRGEWREKLDTELTSEDVAKFNLILWGTPDSNRIIRRLLDSSQFANTLPLTWSTEQVQIGEAQFSSQQHVPVLISPNPGNPNRYVVLNSGPTFR
ncbi:MAG: prolyl oligopeptidase family serine peptidase, partial [Planctomycetota bacterium]